MIARKRIALAVLGVACLGVLVGTAAATLPAGFVVTLLSRGTIGHLDAEHNGVEVGREHGRVDVATATVTIEPDGSSGWHHHPGVVLVSVQSGTVTHYSPSCKTHVYEVGDAFVESDNRPALVRNNGDVQAVVQATFIVPTSTLATGLRIDDPQPSGCSAD